MYKNVLESISDVHIYPIISMVLFILVFSGMLVWVWRKDKGYLNEMASKPLESTEPETSAPVVR